MEPLDIRRIDWGRNPVVAQRDIEHNFDALFRAYTLLFQHKLGSVSLESVDAQRLLSASTDLNSIFIARGEHHDVVRVQAGHNIITGGTSAHPRISVVPEPSFARILSGETDLSDIFYTRKEADDLKHPSLGSGMHSFKKNDVTFIDIRPDPHFERVSARSITASTAQFDSIVYRGRPIEDLLPSHDFSDGTPYLRLSTVDWSRNPEAVREQLENNFRSITKAFNALVEHKMDAVQLSTVSADHIFSGSTPLGELFLAASVNHDIVRVSAGANIVTGGTQNRPIINVSDSPKFRSLSANTIHSGEVHLGGRNLLDIFFTKREAALITHPLLGDNLFQREDTIHVSADPAFTSVRSAGVTADTLSFLSAVYKGKELESWFGSHTFVGTGKNISSGGTPHAPVLSVVDDPIFKTLRSDAALFGSIVAGPVTASTVTSSSLYAEALNVAGMVFDKDGLSTNGMYVRGGCITIGAEPELEISSFLRTKMRLVASDNSPIHYALIVQSPEHSNKRALNEKTVDLVIRGDGHVGIGAFADLSSKLTVSSDGGFDQLRMMTPFTPKDSKDARGAIGNVTWDEGYWYVKTSSGWKRSALEAF